MSGEVDKTVQCKLGNETVTFADKDNAATCLAWMMSYVQWQPQAAALGVRSVISHYHALRMIGKQAAVQEFMKAKVSSGRSLYHQLPPHIKAVMG